MNVRIEPLREAHLDALAELERCCFSEPWTRAQLAEECANPQAAVFVASADGGVAGYAGVHTVLDEAYITDVAVFPQFRRQGVGRLLLRALDDFCVKKGMAFITLEVRASNSAAIALYRSCGYEAVGTRRHFYARPAEDALLMTKYFQNAGPVV